MEVGIRHLDADSLIAFLHSGQHGGSCPGKRELIGVYFNYKLELGPGIKPDEYARFWRKLTEPVEFHTVTVPDEAGDYTFKAYFSNVGDELLRKKGAKNYWKGLTVNFIAKEPART